MSASKHAEQRRRLYLAMLEHPEGVTSKDFAAEPTIDGGEPIPRVSARIFELRAEHTIPDGLRDGQNFAIYKLGQVVTEPAPIRPSAATNRFVQVAVCHGCLTTHRRPFACPHGHRLETMLTGSDQVVDEDCQRQVQEVRRAA